MKQTTDNPSDLGLWYRPAPDEGVSPIGAALWMSRTQAHDVYTALAEHLGVSSEWVQGIDRGFGPRPPRGEPDPIMAGPDLFVAGAAFGRELWQQVCG